MNKKTVMVIDGGGRGASLVHKYSQSSYVDRIIAVPGNDLMDLNSNTSFASYQNLKTTSIKEILEICQKEKVDLVDVAQDDAVAAGLVDALKKEKISCIGPTKAAGEIEWNKKFAREFMQRHLIAQPEFAVFDKEEKGLAYLKNQPDQPWFVKASGLCQGKGALPAKNSKEAAERIKQMKKFGDAGKIYLLEKWLQNKDGSNAEEFSAFVLTDGKAYKIIGYAQDHKRVFDNDLGENTGGMGCSSPPLAITDNIHKQTENIFKKTISGLNNEGRLYKGVLYLGGIIINEKVYVVEFNARWGDPEAEVLVPGIKGDLYLISTAIANGDLKSVEISTDGKARVAVAVSSKGYPGNYSSVIGKEIFGINKAMAQAGVTIYGAGVKKKNNKYYVNGGRLFYIVGVGKNVIEAREKAYSALKYISVEGDNAHYRKDIGWRDMERLKSKNL